MSEGIRAKDARWMVIYDDLKKQIIDYKIAPGSQIRGIRELMEYYKASYSTIHKAIKQLEDDGFVYCIQGKGIFIHERSVETRTIGLILNDMNIPFFSKVIRYIEEELTANNCDILIRSSDFNAETEERIVRHMVDRDVEGILMVPTFETAVSNYLSEVDNHQVPIVCMMRDKVGLDCHCIAPDDYMGARNAAEHLAAYGHKTAGVITSKLINPQQDKRTEGFLEGCRDVGITVKESHILYGDDFEVDSGFRSMSAFLEQDQELPTAFFSYTDSLAIGAMNACTQHGLSVPQDISLMGWNNDEISSLIKPKLTTVITPIEVICRVAVRTLLDLIDSNFESVAKNKIKMNVPVNIVSRESVYNFNE